MFVINISATIAVAVQIRDIVEPFLVTPDKFLGRAGAYRCKLGRERNSYNFPASHATGKAITTRAHAYQVGPRFMLAAAIQHRIDTLRAVFWP